MPTKRSRENNSQDEEIVEQPLTRQRTDNIIDKIIERLKNSETNVKEKDIIRTILLEENIDPTNIDSYIELFRKKYREKLYQTPIDQFRKPTPEEIMKLNKDFYLDKFLPKAYFIVKEIEEETTSLDEFNRMQYYYSYLNRNLNIEYMKKGLQRPTRHDIYNLLSKCTQIYRLFRSRMGLHQGVAYEVHNLYKQIFPKRNEYLKLMEPNIDIEQYLKSSHINKYLENIDTLYNYIQEQFQKQIDELFQDRETKQELFNILMQRAKITLVFNYRTQSELIFHVDPVNDVDKIIIGKSVDFAFSQPEYFRKEYILSFLDESCSSQRVSTGTAYSCSRGIVERFVTAIGSAVQILCSEGSTYCNDTYKKLDDLMNTKYDIRTDTYKWFEILDQNEEYRNNLLSKTKEERINEYVNYIKTNSLNQTGRALEKTYIMNYIQSQQIEPFFETLMLGGKKSKKSKKSNKTSKKMRKTQKTQKINIKKKITNKNIKKTKK